MKNLVFIKLYAVLTGLLLTFFLTSSYKLHTVEANSKIFLKNNIVQLDKNITIRRNNNDLSEEYKNLSRTQKKALRKSFKKQFKAYFKEKIRTKKNVNLGTKILYGLCFLLVGGLSALLYFFLVSKVLVIIFGVLLGILLLGFLLKRFTNWLNFAISYCVGLLFVFGLITLIYFLVSVLAGLIVGIILITLMIFILGGIISAHYYDKTHP